MKIDILEYQTWRGNYVKIKSHHYKKNKIIPNPKWDFHKMIISNIPPALLIFKKEYKGELKERK